MSSSVNLLLIEMIMNKSKVVNLATLLSLVVVLVNFSSSHLEICINDESVNLTSSVRKYPSEKTLQASSTMPLYFGLMVASSEDSDYLNTTVTAVQLALDTINAHPNFLKGYTLYYTLTTSQVKHSVEFKMKKSEFKHN